MSIMPATDKQIIAGMVVATGPVKLAIMACSGPYQGSASEVVAAAAADDISSNRHKAGFVD